MRAALARVSPRQILAITQEVFAAMIDGGETLVAERTGEPVRFADPVAAWVDMTVPSLDLGGRAVVRSERCTADALTRALLAMGDDEPVTPGDRVDAFGELANVVGGNLKSLLAAPATLGLPSVSTAAPVLPGEPVADIVLDWRGRALAVELWPLGIAVDGVA